MNNKIYTCDSCHGTFEAAWTEEEARAEQRGNFGDMPDSEMAEVCDDCYKAIMTYCHPGFEESEAGAERG